MINKKLLNPESIVVIGGSNDIRKPGGKVLKNLLARGFDGVIYVLNPEEDEVQGIGCCKNIDDLPDADLAIIAVPAEFCTEIIRVLAGKKNTGAFIVISSGFGEAGDEGKRIEDEIVSIVNNAGAVLIGPNVIGVITEKYCGVFTEPLPLFDPQGADLISGSGATAVFIFDSGISRGLRFASLFSVGNSAQTGVEDILKYMDENFDPVKSSKIKILYLEDIRDPKAFLKHASSLILKGCSIAAIKAGGSDAGGRAASSHTGAMVTSDAAVDALFCKAGIVRCHSRDELVTVASIFTQKRGRGKNFAVITHAGGPGVMLADTLSENGLGVPQFSSEDSVELLKYLNPGSSALNPVDFLATGTAGQLGRILDFTEAKTDIIDAAVVIFGTPGLRDIFDVYDVLHEKMLSCAKPVYPVFPSALTAAGEIRAFTARGHVYFPDEVLLGNALGKVYNAHGPYCSVSETVSIDENMVRSILDSASPGFMHPAVVQKLLDACKIPRAAECIVSTLDDALKASVELHYPLVMKGAGLVHKSDSGGVSLNIDNDEQLSWEFKRISAIPEVREVILQPMLSGTELFIGAKYEKPFGHIILCGIGGIFVELLNDTASGLVPVGRDEALDMIRSLKSYKIFKGVRGGEPIDENLFADIILKVSALLEAAPEISELDLNPLMAERGRITVADSRVKTG